MDQNAVTLQNLIGGILTPQQEIHQQAQDQYFAIMKNDPSQLFLSLGTVLLHSQERVARLFAAVILRQQSLPAKTAMNAVDPAVIAQLKAISMQLFQTEPNPEMRRKVIEFAAVFASRLFTQHTATPNPADAWPEILQLTCRGAGMVDQPQIQASCFDMIAQIAEYSIQVFQGQDETLVQLLSAALTPTTPIDVAIAAATATLTLIVSYRYLHETKVQPGVQIDEPVVAALQNSIDTFSKAVPLVCTIFARALSEQRENKLGQFLQFFDKAVHLHPNAFSSSFNDLVNFIISIAKHPDLEPSFRERCLSLLIRFGNNPAGRAVCRKHPIYQQSLLALGFEFLHDIEYTQQWAANPLYATKDEDEWPNFHLGIFILRSLPQTMGTKTFLTPMLQEVIKRAGDNSTWKQPHAALFMLSALCEDHLKAFPKPAVTAIQQMLVSFTNPKITTKANPRVTVAALQAVAAFATKLGQKSGKEVLSNVLGMLPPDANQLLQVPGTMIFYSSRCLAILSGLLTKENLKPYVPRLLPAISTCLGHPLGSVSNSALVCVSALALQLGPDFAEHANSVISALTSLLQQCNTDLQQALASKTYQNDPAIHLKMEDRHRTRNKTVETLAFIAEALGHDLFLPYSSLIIELIAQSQQLEMAYPNAIMHFVFSAFGKIADCLQEDFGPYLGQILPGLLHAATLSDFHYRFDLDGDNNLSAADQAQAAILAERGFISQDISLHGLGAQRVAINSNMVNDKIQSLEMLGEFAISLKEAFGPFLHQTASVLIPECTTVSNPRIRWSAATTLPALLECLYHQPGVAPDAVLGFFSQCITAFDLPTWVKKELPEGLEHLIGATTACIDALHQAGISTIPDEPLQVIAQAFVDGWNICLERRHAIEQEVMIGDEEQLELKSEAIAIENAALDSLVALNTELLRTNRDKYFPFFANVVEPLFAAGCGTANQMDINGTMVKRDPYLYTCSLIGYSDSIAQSGALGVPYIQKIFPLFMRDALDEADHELRRGAAYGISTCHRALPMADFAPFVNAAIETLAKSAAIEYNPPPDQYDEDTDESSIYAQDNALGGLTDIMTRYGCGFLTPSCAHSLQEQQNFAAIQNFLQPQFMAQYMSIVVDKLGCFHDEEEAIHIHHNFTQWLQKCPQSVYGSDNRNIPQAIRIIAHILDLDQEYAIVNPEDLEALQNVWRGLRTSIPQEVLVQLMAKMDPDLLPMLQFE